MLTSHVNQLYKTILLCLRGRLMLFGMGVGAGRDDLLSDAGELLEFLI